MTRAHKRRTAIALTALVAAPLAVITTTATPATAGDGPLASSVAVSWQRTALRTIFTETVPTPAPPVVAIYLSFTSLAVHDAAREALRGGGTLSATAAVAQAAHDVLWEYFPASRTNLDADLAASLDLVKDGRKEDRGVAIGAEAADRMIASRVGDGRGDTSIVYSKPAGPGVWQPPATGMALAWLGFMKPVVGVPTVQLDGPDPLGSPAYAIDYNEVKRVGSTTSETSGDRTAAETEISRFFNNPITVILRDALIRRMQAEPMGLLPTTRLFARIDAAQVESFIQTWRLKYDVGFWRPFQAIAGAGGDGNGATDPQTGWAPLITNPAYSDYTSGHAAGTSPFAEIMRQTFGDDTPLVLKWPGFADHPYATLTALEHDAFMARIWGGLHFRDAMEDGYLLGRTVARDVMCRVR
jgi:hypothetical protein